MYEYDEEIQLPWDWDPYLYKSPSDINASFSELRTKGSNNLHTLQSTYLCYLLSIYVSGMEINKGQKAYGKQIIRRD